MCTSAKPIPLPQVIHRDMRNVFLNIFGVWWLTHNCLEVPRNCDIWRNAESIPCVLWYLSSLIPEPEVSATRWWVDTSNILFNSRPNELAVSVSLYGGGRTKEPLNVHSSFILYDSMCSSLNHTLCCNQFYFILLLPKLCYFGRWGKDFSLWGSSGML